MKNLSLGIALRICNIFLMLCHFVIIAFTAAYLAEEPFSVGVLLVAIWIHPLLFLTQRKLSVVRWGSTIPPQTKSVDMDCLFLEEKQKEPSISLSPHESFLGRFFAKKYPEYSNKVKESERINMANLGNKIGRQIKLVSRLELALEAWIYGALFFVVHTFMSHIHIYQQDAFQGEVMQGVLWEIAPILLISLIFMATVSERRSVLKKNIETYEKQKDKEC